MGRKIWVGLIAANTFIAANVKIFTIIVTHSCPFHNRMHNATKSVSISDAWSFIGSATNWVPLCSYLAFINTIFDVLLHIEDEEFEARWSEWPIMWTPLPVQWQWMCFVTCRRVRGGALSCWKYIRTRTVRGTHPTIPTTHVPEVSLMLYLSDVPPRSGPVSLSSITPHHTLTENRYWKFAFTMPCWFTPGHKYTFLVFLTPSQMGWPSSVNEICR
jgi:hypothetical protein